MSQATRDFETSMKSTNDLKTTPKRYYIMKHDTTNAGRAFVIAAAATDPLVGVLQDTPAAGEAGTIRFVGTSKVIYGGTVTQGDVLTSDANGKAVTTTTNKDVVLGRAMVSGVSGDIGEVLLNVGVKQSQ